MRRNRGLRLLGITTSVLVLLACWNTLRPLSHTTNITFSSGSSLPQKTKAAHPLVVDVNVSNAAVFQPRNDSHPSRTSAPFSKLSPQQAALLPPLRKHAKVCYCTRHCAHTNNVLMNADFRPKTGLNDRLFVWHALADLAAYLCARLYVPPPAAVLGADVHNHVGAHFVSSANQSTTTTTFDKENDDLHWSDFVQFQWTDPQRKEEQVLNEMEAWQGTLESLEQAYPSTHWKIIDGVHAKSIPKHFAMAKDMVDAQQTNDTDTKPFVWILRTNWYTQQQYLKPYLEQQKVQATNDDGINPSFLPLVSQCVYHSTQLAPSLQPVVSTVWKAIVQASESNNNKSKTYVGYLHIRRGDAVDECDTSLERMERYFNCSFQSIAPTNNNTSITVLFGSDESDPTYRRRIEELIQQASPHIPVAVLDMDAIVWTALETVVQQGLLKHTVLNNFHRIHVMNHFMWSSSMAFVLEMRRHQSCWDCARMDRMLERPHVRSLDKLMLLADWK